MEVCQRPSAIRTGTSAEVVNTSTTTRYGVLCPIVGDAWEWPFGIERASVSTNSSATVCDLYARRDNGERTGRVAGSNIYYNGKYSVTFPQVNAGVSSVYYYIDCTLPPNGRIYMYRVAENDGED